MSVFKSFLICAPRYRDESGGAIVLHKLCDTLNKLGHDAKLWPLWKPRLSRQTRFDTIPSALTYFGSRLYRGEYTTNELYDTPVATKLEVEGRIVVYPEIVSGNPLGAERYVRWLLHRPGFHTRRTEYRHGDLFFSYQDSFNCLGCDFKHGGTLKVSEAFLDVYRQTNTSARTKICHMVRKGRGRSDLPDLRREWVVDGRSHQELAAIFNECSICYFYDLYTSYSTYAAVCGCIPVIVPMKGVDKTQWLPEEHHRAGLAYGIDEVPHAIATRQILLDNLNVAEEKNIETVKQFVTTVHEHFST